MQKNNPININTSTYWNSVYGNEEKREGYAATGTDRATDGFQKTNRFTKALEYIKPKDRFLDIGCGVGVMTKLAKDTYPDCEVWGVDISDRAMKDNKAERPDINYQAHEIGNKLNLPKFDVIFCGETIEHLDDPKILFHEAYDLLTDKGKLIITTPREDRINSPEHTWFFQQSDVEQLFIGSGFKEVKFEYLPDREHIFIIYAIGQK